MDRQITFDCPYCGIKNKQVVLVTTHHDMEVVYCDPDQGGCDEWLVLRTIFKPEVEVFMLSPVQESG